ncbi:MAG TPA: BON domain-containing protein [Polyangiaceae bacterium]|nr:BON domain-containing protein [Polyangiaceae bacterium]
MYYAWSWWWWFGWIIPMFVIIWVIYAWGGRAYSRRGDRDMYLDDRYDGWLAGSASARRGYRNRGPLNYHRADARIFEDVCDRLMTSDYVDASAMEVKVDDGKVVLSGAVATRFERRLAEQIADYVPGVLDVDNHLTIGKPDVASPSRSIVDTTSSRPAA